MKWPVTLIGHKGDNRLILVGYNTAVTNAKGHCDFKNSTRNLFGIVYHLVSQYKFWL